MCRSVYIRYAERRSGTRKHSNTCAASSHKTNVVNPGVSNEEILIYLVEDFNG